MNQTEGVIVLAIVGIAIYGTVQAQAKQKQAAPGAGGPGTGGGASSTTSQVPGPAPTTDYTGGTIPGFSAIPGNCFPPNFVGPLPEGAHYCTVGDVLNGFFSGIYDLFTGQSVTP